MKSATSSRHFHLAVIALIRRVLPTLLLAPLLSLPAATSAAEARISFSGAITQPTCAMAPMPATPSKRDHSQTNEQDLTLQTPAACGAQAVPVSTQFLPIAPTAEVKAGFGILILTYR